MLADDGKAPNKAVTRRERSEAERPTFTTRIRPPPSVSVRSRSLFCAPSVCWQHKKRALTTNQNSQRPAPLPRATSINKYALRAYGRGPSRICASSFCFMFTRGNLLLSAIQRPSCLHKAEDLCINCGRPANGSMNDGYGDDTRSPERVNRLRGTARVPPIAEVRCLRFRYDRA